jgi:predicted permease
MHSQWRQLVRSHLPELGLPAERAEPIIDELAELLEDFAAEQHMDGAPADELEAWVATQVPSWKELARGIQVGRGRARQLPSPTRQRSRERGGARWLDGLVKDLRYAARKLRKDRGFTAAALLTLAAGIGLNTAVFSIVNAVLLKPLPVAEPGRLVNVYTNDTAATVMAEMPLAYPDFQDLTGSTTLASLAGYSWVDLVLEVDGNSEVVVGELVTGDYFATLGVVPAGGRMISPMDDAAGQPNPVAVLSHSAWQRRFGADPDIIDRRVRVNGHPYTIVGVAPPGFAGLTRGLDPPLWLPLRTAYALGATATIRMGTATAGLDRFADRNPKWIWAVGRLRPESTLEQLRVEMDTTGAALRQAYPDTNERRSFQVVRTDRVRILPMVDRVLYGGSVVLMAMVALVLLIACTNLASLQLTRATERRQEIVTRLAIGAGRRDIIRQLQMESLLLALLGGALGLGLGVAAVRTIGHLDLPVMVDLSLDLRVLLFALIVSTLAAVAFGLTPALAATRVDLAAVLRSDARGVTGTPKRRLVRGALVVAQVAMSLLLLICAGLSLRSVLNAHRIDPGFDPAGVLVANLSPGLQGYSDERAETFFRALEERVAALPGVATVSFANHLPLTFALSTAGVAAVGEEPPQTEQWPQIARSFVDPGYFSTMGIPFIDGRDFSEQDTPDSTPVAVVNQALANLLWPGASAVGKRLRVDDGSEHAYLVVGVIEDSKYLTMGEDPRPHLHRSLTQHTESNRILVVRSSGLSAPLMNSIWNAVRNLDSRIAVTGLEPLEQRISDALLVPRASALVFGVAGLVGLALAAFGVYGVIAYGVSQRTREIGIRVAMGARPHSILCMTMQQALVLTVLGISLGLAAALVTTRALAAVLCGVAANDPLTFVVVPVFLVLVALVAGLVPARRAVSVDPSTALRWQ